MTKKEKKFLDKKLEEFLKRLETPQIKEVFVRLKNRQYEQKETKRQKPHSI